MKNKVLFDLRLLMIFIPTFYFGWLSETLDATFYLGLSCIISVSIGTYFIITYLFYDKIYKDKD